ncbi:MAG: glycosyltransferase family 2 protein [Methanobrevibacter sp.]|uniref:glycosyltransferase family 2 protein n=1 Tax=Methanobrevibacter sp. TaxID=66852 RepID=UPI0026DF35EB|nr:glycosyltransferase family 2 protein [Methanobrevibacter sp.]MDO5848646.1 glycosyltransferase family 2 protein [Methanobrevibacter sp.]
MNIDVSVIIPVYNSSKYISETLDSVINQDFNSFELIIVNDGSVDNSLDIIKNTLKDSKIYYTIINQENNGVSHARNVGIENAKGQYVIFVDDDDIIAKNHISCLFENANGNDGSFTEMLKITEKGEIVGDQELYLSIDGKNRISSKDLIKLELTMNIPFSFCQIMYKKELITEKFNENAIYGEDTEFVLKNLINANVLGICPKPTYFYRQRENSATGKADFKRFEIVDIFENLARYYEKNNLNDLAELIITNRIPKAIFGNLMYFFYHDYEFNQLMNVMKQLDLLIKLKNFKGESKFRFKIKLFLLNPKLYYRAWKTFKDGIE